MRILVLICSLAWLAACGSAKSPGKGTECPVGTVVDPSTMQCVQCVQGNNNCPSGQTCSPNGTCVAGCSVDTDCNNGQTCCNHQCVDATSDPNNCGMCGNTCGQGQGCCSGSCTDLSSLTSCGSCGNTCASGDFCDGTACQMPTYPNFCNNKTVWVIHDGIAADNDAADEMASTITANCPADVMVHTGDQSDPTLVDQSTGQPLGGSGVTYVLGGGPFPDMPLKWLEQTQQITKVYFDAPDGVNFYWRDRATGNPVAMMAGSDCSPSQDQFVTELVTDPGSGTLSLIGYGACSGGQGTLAAAWYYANVILPNRASYPDSWYVFSWSDTDGDGTPSAGDTFTVLAHGT